ncbi:hypothetical protein D3C75_751750 [compost metagenome]
MRLQQLQCSYQKGEDAPPVNIRNQQYRGVSPAGEIHIDDIPCLQVNLGRTAGAFHQHGIIAVTQPSERRHNSLFRIRKELLAVLPRTQRRMRYAMYYNLCAHLP